MCSCVRSEHSCFVQDRLYYEQGNPETEDKGEFQFQFTFDKSRKLNRPEFLVNAYASDSEHGSGSQYDSVEYKQIGKTRWGYIHSFYERHTNDNRDTAVIIKRFQVVLSKPDSRKFFELYVHTIYAY